MKSPAPEGAPRIDISCEELEALLEGARAALGETGYQKLQAAIRTLGYVTELLQNQEATLASLRRLLCHSSTEKTSWRPTSPASRARFPLRPNSAAQPTRGELCSGPWRL